MRFEGVLWDELQSAFPIPAFCTGVLGLIADGNGLEDRLRLRFGELWASF